MMKKTCNIVKAKCKINDNIIQIKKADIDNNIKVKSAEVKIINKLVDVDHYEGPYFAIPKNFNQMFETEKKVMDDDFVVEKVPDWLVSNVKGKTFIIGQ